MKGDKVVVLSSKDKLLIRRVWEATQDVVYICSEENYQTLSDGKQGLLPVGFPREFVYRYNPKVDLNSASAKNILSAYD